MLRLRELRKASGVRVQEIADACGVKPDAVMRWEREENQLKVSDACKIANVLGCTLNELVGLPPDAPNEDPQDVVELRGIYSRLSMSDKSVLMRVARALGS